MAQKDQESDRFIKLTWDDLLEWAGNTILSRGQSYQRDGHVKQLARTTSGGLLAWVEGTERYATWVEFEGEELTADGTCPYGGTCKHAVAVEMSHDEGETAEEISSCLDIVFQALTGLLRPRWNGCFGR